MSRLKVQVLRGSLYFIVQFVNNKPAYTVLDHTADIFIRVFGDTEKTLFCTAAQALFDIIAERTTDQSTPLERIEIRLVAESREDLFVMWLNELLSLSSARELVFEEFAMHAIGELSLHATVGGAARDEFRYKTEVKAATYHQLKITQTQEGWQAEVVFDV